MQGLLDFSCYDPATDALDALLTTITVLFVSASRHSFSIDRSRRFLERVMAPRSEEKAKRGARGGSGRTCVAQLGNCREREGSIGIGISGLLL